MKQAAGRPKDTEDLTALLKIKSLSPVRPPDGEPR